MEKKDSPIEIIGDIYNKYYRYLLHFLLSLTSDKQLAEDMVQDIFSKILLNPRTVLDIRNVKSFLVTSARNHMVDYYRKKKPSLFKDEQIIEKMLVDNYSFNQVEEADEINEILLRLPPQYNFVIIARDYYGYNYQEIADFLGVSLTNVKTRIFRARRAFLKQYQEVNKCD